MAIQTLLPKIGNGLLTGAVAGQPGTARASGAMAGINSGFLKPMTSGAIAGGSPQIQGRTAAAMGKPADIPIGTSYATGSGASILPKPNSVITNNNQNNQNNNQNQQNQGPQQVTKPENPYLTQLKALQDKLNGFQTSYADFLKPSQQETDTQSQADAIQNQLRNLNASAALGLANIQSKPIALEFQTGQQAALQRQAAAQAQALGAEAEPLQTQLARLQAQRQASADASKYQIDTAQNQIKDFQSQYKPNEVTAGTNLVRLNPDTGEYETVFSAPKKADDSKPITQVVNKQLLQYDPQSGKWNVVNGGSRPSSGVSYTGSGSSSGSKISSNPEVESWVKNIQSGAAKITSVPAKLKNAVSVALANGSGNSNSNNELKNTALKSAQDLLDSFNSGNNYAVGKSSILPVIPGTESQDFVNQYDNLKSLLSLDNIKLLKGQGAVSDSERKLLAEASTKLNRNQSEGEFQKTLQDLVNNLKGASGSSTSKTNSAPSKSAVDAAKNKYGISYE